MERLRENKMGTQPVFKLIVSMSLPAMFSMLVQALYNIVDSYFVAQINESALTAVSLAFPIQSLLIAVAVGTGIGINSLVSRRLGEHRRDEASNAATHGIFLTFASWILFALFGLFFTRMFFEAFTDTAAVVDMGAQYGSIVTIFSFGVFVEINIEKTLQATGNMMYPMFFQLVGALVNIVLDPVFIFGFAGIPAMGVAGAAIATVIGQIVAMLLSVFVLFHNEHEVHISFQRFQICWKTIREIYAVGFPSIIMQAIGSLLVIGMNAILLMIMASETAVAFFGVYFKLQSFIFMPVYGLTHGVMPIMGYNFGAGKRERLLSALRIGCILALLIMTLGTLLFWSCPEWMLHFFNASPQMLSIGIPALRTISISFIPAALGIMFSTIFQAVGKGMYSLTVSFLRQLVVLLPSALFLSQFGLYYVWYSFPIAEVVSFCASLGIFYMMYLKQFKNLKPIELTQAPKDTKAEEQL